MYKGHVLALLCMFLSRSVSAQQLTFSECATECTSEVTSQFSTCNSGIQCFCTNSYLWKLGQHCFNSNCTIQEALVAQNITALSCSFPDRNRGPDSSWPTFTSLAVALCLVVTRVIALAPNIKTLWGWDDVLVAFATVVAICNAASTLVARHYGYGRDAWRLTFDNTKAVEEIYYIGGVFFVVGLTTIKTTFLVFYLKLFPSPAFRRMAIPLLVITLLHGTTFFFLFIFQCSPINYAWTLWVGQGQGKCLDFGLGAVLHAVMNIMLDFLIFALPISQLWNLNLSRKKKVQVIAMFCVGFLITIVSILRLWTLIALADTYNPTYDAVPLGAYSDLEFNIGIACICMPSFRLVLRRYLPSCSLFSSKHGASKHDDDHSAPAPRAVNLTGSGLDQTTTRSFRISSEHDIPHDFSYQPGTTRYQATVESNGSHRVLT
ncbi:hypothetical protein EDD37DRAFT_400218 [Exophiala viscosa]|uniref:Extracellular membrane protein CFEM domain-containing protein n=1 Tax=Exophiala viscosa TaxID=2486360 RepID=A0AAN6E0W2_9EURO|nr:hypothetical protein EDD36DRAFT_171009 [Exophiala viscosa]KAI1624102.1 hypothetical protein EDD37DRAFT_400218 [Exophiala viscosa]